MSNLMLGIILGLWSGVAMVLDLSGLGVRTPIITGLLAGLCCGNLQMGLQVGSVMLINSLGFYTYGGATILRMQVQSQTSLLLNPVVFMVEYCLA